MSWSVSAIGKTDKVAEKVAGDFQRINYLAKEEADLKDQAAALVANVLAANTHRYQAIKVDCSGSGSTHAADGNSQQIRITIEPVWGFVE
jgi:hypothetical protein